MNEAVPEYAKKLNSLSRLKQDPGYRGAGVGKPDQIRYK